MSRIILSALVIYLVLLLLSREASSAHRTHAARHKTLRATRPKTSSMRQRMMDVLHLRDDKSLNSMFDMEEDDPPYVFVLPDKRNKTIVFHRRDFTRMEYPKISEVGRMEGPVFYRELNKTAAFRDIVLRSTKKPPSPTAPIAERLTVRDSDEWDWDLSEEEEEEMNRIVEENVRTERNFIQYVEDLNKKTPQREAKTTTSFKGRKRPAKKYQHSDHFHPALFHHPPEQDQPRKIIKPPPPQKHHSTPFSAAQEEEDYDEEDYEVAEDEEGEEGDERRGHRRPTKVKGRPGYGNIGEVVSPPFYEDSADKSEELIGDYRLLKSQKKNGRPSQPPRKSYSDSEGVNRDSGGEGDAWDALGLDGWSGGLSDPVEEFEEKPESPPPSDIFREGITYNRMKEMFRNVEHSYHQVQQSEPPATSYGVPVASVPSYYEAPPTIPAYQSDGHSWGSGSGSHFNQQSYPRPTTQFQDELYETGDEDEGESEDHEDSYAFRPTSGYQAPSEEEEYIAPRIKPQYQKKKKTQYKPPTPIYEPSQDYVDEEEDHDFVTEESADDEEYVYMINGKPISLELAQLLQAENVPLNFTRHIRRPTSGPKWHLTTSRSSHRDSDVFVARANNPFGHSTKWQWSNASSTYVIPKKGKRDKKRSPRSKRGIAELYSMVKCATGCDPLIYKGYGCYCGFLGQGTPLDGIDKCCKMHDDCYNNSGCPAYLEYFVPYLWKCYKGTPLCAISHGEWGDANSCAARLCQCDLKLSMCLRRYYCPLKRNVCTSSPWRVFQNFIMDF